jgi:aminoglycoside phosphotransferase (APT) family kinase protein
MHPPEIARAISAARSIVSALGLPADDAIVLWNSNKLALRILPADVFARVAYAGQEVAQFEVALAQRLAEANSPAATLEPRVEPRPYERDGFIVTLWNYYEPLATELSPGDYASALKRLHAAMREIDIPAPHFTDRVTEAEQLVATPDLSPALTDTDRDCLAAMLQDLRHAVCDHAAPEQLLHGEPHPGNLLNTNSGPRFIDLETCCRGPVEFDLAHVPEAVSQRYPGADSALLADCRGLALAMVAAWRWDRSDQFPNGLHAGRTLLRTLRAGPPWPTLDAAMQSTPEPPSP